MGVHGNINMYLRDVGVQSACVDVWVLATGYIPLFSWLAAANEISTRRPSVDERFFCAEESISLCKLDCFFYPNSLYQILKIYAGKYHRPLTVEWCNPVGMMDLFVKEFTEPSVPRRRLKSFFLIILFVSKRISSSCTTVNCYKCAECYVWLQLLNN